MGIHDGPYARVILGGSGVRGGDTIIDARKKPAQNNTIS